MAREGKNFSSSLGSSPLTFRQNGDDEVRVITLFYFVRSEDGYRRELVEISLHAIFFLVKKDALASLELLRLPSQGSLCDQTI